MSRSPRSPRSPLSPKQFIRRSARSSDLSEQHRTEIKYLNLTGIRAGLCKLDDFLQQYPEVWKPYGAKTAFSRQIDQWNRFGKDSTGAFIQPKPTEIPSQSEAPLAYSFIKNLKLVDPNNPRLNHRMSDSDDRSDSDDSIASIEFEAPPTPDYHQPIPSRKAPASKAKASSVSKAKASSVSKAKAVPASKATATMSDPPASSMPNVNDFDYMTALKYNQVYALDFKNAHNNPPGVEAFAIDDVVVKDPKGRDVTVRKGIVLHPMSSIENAEMVSGLHCMSSDGRGFTLIVPAQDYSRIENSTEFHEWISENLECDGHESQVTKKVIIFNYSSLLEMTPLTFYHLYSTIKTRHPSSNITKSTSLSAPIRPMRSSRPSSP